MVPPSHPVPDVFPCLRNCGGDMVLESFCARYRCIKCGNLVHFPFEQRRSGQKPPCPTCGTSEGMWESGPEKTWRCGWCGLAHVDLIIMNLANQKEYGYTLDDFKFPGPDEPEDEPDRPTPIDRKA
jgi:DNA-directed RNA polymerase subunit RPC12/RpoP